MSDIKFNIKDYKLHTNFNELVRVKLKEKFNDRYDWVNRDSEWKRDSEINDYNTYIICEVTELLDTVTKIKVGDEVILKMCYIVALKDIFEGFSEVDENDLILPYRLIAGVINE